MRVCWIKAGGFVPLDFGGRIRSFHMVKELARRHEVTVLTFYPQIQGDQHPHIAPLFAELILVPLEMPEKRSLAEYLDYIRLLPASHAYSMQKYYRPKLRRAVNDLFARKTFDAIVCDFIYPAGVLNWSSGIPILLFTHNFEAQVWERQFRVTSNPIRKFMFWLEYQRLGANERHYASRAAQVLAVSESNRQFFGQYVGGAENVTLLSTGVDTDFFYPVPDAEKEGSLVFTGSMDWWPNSDAMEWFYREILPLIRVEEPDAETWMVGREPPASLQMLVKADAKVHLTGRVEDVRPFMNQATVYFLPMRTGSGTRLKVFEAMAAGKAIVSTPIGAEGLPVKHGENILLASDPKEFADSVRRLMRDHILRRRLGASARKLADSGFSWRAVTARLEEALFRAVGHRTELTRTR